MTGTSSGSSSRARRPTGESGERVVFLDTNALLLPIRVRFPLREEVERIRPGARLRVPSSVLEELDRLAERSVRGARAAAMLAREFPVTKVDGRGDSGVLAAAVRHKASVVTADRELAARLRKHGVDVFVPRDRHRLELRAGREKER